MMKFQLRTAIAARPISTSKVSFIRRLPVAGASGISSSPTNTKGYAPR